MTLKQYHEMFRDLTEEGGADFIVKDQTQVTIAWMVTQCHSAIFTNQMIGTGC